MCVLFKFSLMAERGRELFILEQHLLFSRCRKRRVGLKYFVTSLLSKQNTQVKHCSETEAAALKTRVAATFACQKSLKPSEHHRLGRRATTSLSSQQKVNFMACSIFFGSFNLVLGMRLHWSCQRSICKLEKQNGHFHFCSEQC